jgi:hypothetical protein
MTVAKMLFDRMSVSEIQNRFGALLNGWRGNRRAPDYSNRHYSE